LIRPAAVFVAPGRPNPSNGRYVAKVKKQRTAPKPEYHPDTWAVLDSLDPMKRFVNAVSDALSKPSLPLPPGVERSWIVSDEEAARWNPPASVSPPEPTGAGIWIKAEVERMRAASDNIRIPSKIELARRLAHRMYDAAKDGRVCLPDSDKTVGPASARYICNNLEKWGCWPL
jgi:hypothetical protein